MLIYTFACTGSSADRMSNERLIKEHLRDIMRTEDLDNLTSKMVSCGQMYTKEEVGFNKDRALLEQYRGNQSSNT